MVSDTRELSSAVEADCGCGGDCGPCASNYGLGADEAGPDWGPSGAAIHPVGLGTAAIRAESKVAPGSAPDPDPAELPDPQSLLARIPTGIGPTLAEFKAARTPGGCPDVGVEMALPDFGDVAWPTQVCFVADYGRTGWPETDCCPPALDPPVASYFCPPPTHGESVSASLYVTEWGATGFSTFVELFEDRSTHLVQPTEGDRLFFGAALAVLLENGDIADWVMCLTDSCSPELPARAQALLSALLKPNSDGQFPWYVVYVDLPDQSGLATTADGATAWAYTMDKPMPDPLVLGLGLILPIEHRFWIANRESYLNDGGKLAFCAAVTYAAIILHELVHIVGDVTCPSGAGRDECLDDPGLYLSGYDSPWEGWLNQGGAIHEQDEEDKPNYVPNPCWDEGRMVMTMFKWAMLQRYPCLAGIGASDGCRKYRNDETFAHSAAGV